MTTARNREIDRMALAHACIAPSLFLGEKRRRRGLATAKAEEAKAKVAECKQEAEGEKDAGGRVVDVAGTKVMGISFSRVYRSVCISFLLVCTSASFFPGTRFALSRFSFRGSRSVHLSKVYYNCSRKERIVLEI